MRRSVTGGRHGRGRPDGLGFMWTFTLHMVIKLGECSRHLLIEGIWVL